jgi:hypothetical protein
VFSECSAEKCCHAMASSIGNAKELDTVVSEKKPRTVQADEGGVPHLDDRARTAPIKVI